MKLKKFMKMNKGKFDQIILYIVDDKSDNKTVTWMPIELFKDYKVDSFKVLVGSKHKVPCADLYIFIKEPKTKKLCPKCGVNKATKPHTCPQKEDLADDYETLCTCCGSCQTECAEGI